jgi:5-methylcytosine-specific restriction endonuclease McrA
LSKKSKKDTPLYDEKGRWVEEQNRIESAVRKAFRLSPMMSDCKRSARIELEPEAKKDGTPGKRVRVRYKCAACGELFSDKHLAIDHIFPVVPLHIPRSEMTYDELVRGIFCGLDNLQVLCSTPMKLNGGKPSCHKMKTDKENYIRRRFKDLFDRFCLACEGDGAELFSAQGILKFKEYLNNHTKTGNFNWCNVQVFIQQFGAEYDQSLIEKAKIALEKEAKKLEREKRKLAKIK